MSDCVSREDLLQFALWVAKEVTISDETAEEINMTFSLFAELACRKLYKLGIVQTDETERYWQLSELVQN